MVTRLTARSESQASQYSVDAPEETPESKLMRAALYLFFRDAVAYLKNCENVPKHWITIENLRFQKEAFDDLCACGEITRRLAEFNGLDARILSSRFRSYVRQYYAANPESET